MQKSRRIQLPGQSAGGAEHSFVAPHPAPDPDLDQGGRHDDEGEDPPHRSGGAEITAVKRSLVEITDYNEPAIFRSITPAPIFQQGEPQLEKLKRTERASGDD